MKTNWDNDKKVEREVAAFLDEYLYSNAEFFKEFIRTDTRDEQLSGSDLLLSTPDGKLNHSIVDEKAAIDYANKDLKTFSLELSSKGKYGKINIGWFLDKSKKTEYYLFVWILKADLPKIDGTDKDDTNKITKDNIRKLEYALVKKSDIIKFLEENGWTLEKISKQNDEIRKMRGVKRYDFVNGVTFRYTARKPEKPINILLKKETYINISTLHGIIEK